MSLPCREVLRAAVKALRVGPVPEVEAEIAELHPVLARTR